VISRKAGSPGAGGRPARGARGVVQADGLKTPQANTGNVTSSTPARYSAAWRAEVHAEAMGALERARRRDEAWRHRRDADRARPDELRSWVGGRRP
jgi:hypothetical protein